MPRPPDSPEVRKLKEYRKRMDRLLREYPVSDNRWVNGQLRGYMQAITKLRVTIKAQGRKDY